MDIVGVWCAAAAVANDELIGSSSFARLTNLATVTLSAVAIKTPLSGIFTRPANLFDSPDPFSSSSSGGGERGEGERQKSIH